MTWEAQHNAIRSRFNTEWASATPIHWENVAFTPPDNSAWVRLVVGDADARQASMGDPGNNVFRHVGIVTVMIFTPLNVGDDQALELADQAAAIFRGWEHVASGVRFRVSPYLRRVGSENSWYHVNLLCPFERDSFF